MRAFRRHALFSQNFLALPYVFLSGIINMKRRREGAELSSRVPHEAETNDRKVRIGDRYGTIGSTRIFDYGIS